jgi:spore germination cell wall hydrolase CwlJ-like protein
MAVVNSNNVPLLCANVYAPAESEPFGCQVVINGVSLVNVTLTLKIKE